MPSSTTLSGHASRLALALVLVGLSAGGAAGQGRGGPGGQVVARALIPAHVAGRPTAALAAHALTAQGWPVAMVDTVRGIVASQWLYFKQGPQGSNCWIRLRLVAQPVAGDSAQLQVGAQAWLLERVGTEAALDYARSLFDAFRADAAAGAPAEGAHGKLGPLLQYTDGDFVVCGARSEPTARTE